MKDHEIIELYWARNESAITATTEKYGNYCHTLLSGVSCFLGRIILCHQKKAA